VDENRFRETWRLGQHVAVLVVLGSVALGCLTSHVEFDRKGMRNVHHGYTLGFTSAADREFIDGDWRVRNYLWKPELKRFVPKKTREFAGYISYDREDDGEIEREKAYYFDLVLEHAKTDGEIWIAVRELTVRNKQRKLDVILDSYVDSLAGTTIDVFSSTFGHRLRRERRFASTLIEAQEVDLAGHPALLATISISDVDQLQLDPNHVFGRVRLLLTRFTGKTLQPDPKMAGAPHASKKHLPGEVLLIAGYFNNDDYFEAQLADFEGFISRIEFDDTETSGLDVPPAAEAEEDEKPTSPTDTGDDPEASADGDDKTDVSDDGEDEGSEPAD
jgi:hypothetical protein